VGYVATFTFNVVSNTVAFTTEPALLPACGAHAAAPKSPCAPVASVLFYFRKNVHLSERRILRSHQGCSRLEQVHFAEFDLRRAPMGSGRNKRMANMISYQPYHRQFTI